MQFTYQVENGFVRTPGVCFGDGKPAKLVKESDKYLLIQVKGHRGWSGVGHTLYYPAKFTILTKVNKKECDTMGAGEGEFTYTKQTRHKVTKDALAKWEELNPSKGEANVQSDKVS